MINAIVNIIETKAKQIKTESANKIQYWKESDRPTFSIFNNQRVLSPQKKVNSCQLISESIKRQVACSLLPSQTEMNNVVQIQEIDFAVKICAAVTHYFWKIRFLMAKKNSSALFWSGKFRTERDLRHRLKIFYTGFLRPIQTQNHTRRSSCSAFMQTAVLVRRNVFSYLLSSEFFVAFQMESFPISTFPDSWMKFGAKTIFAREKW